ncbi:MAG: hypothetical protein WAN43_14360, partial [Rhodomicrobium sp.]
RFDVRGALKRPRTQSEPFPLDSGLHREIRAGAATSLRRGLANRIEPDFSHSLGLLLPEMKRLHRPFCRS